MGILLSTSSICLSWDFRTTAAHRKEAAQKCLSKWAEVRRRRGVQEPWRRRRVRNGIVEAAEICVHQNIGAIVEVE